ncbi:MAG: two-component system sensor histidine kinase FlrB [Candidatus Azotimanducaceae bacterium]|jgi:two-component system sensor histidine kinase FlrB
MTHHPSSVAQKNSTEQLAAAFHLFNQLSDNLGESYRELQHRVENLSEELANERSKRFVDLALKEQLAHRLAGLLSCLPGGVIVLDPGDRVVDSNPEGKAILGDHCVGRLWSELLFEKTCTALGESELFKQSEVKLLNGNYISLSERVVDAEGGGIVLVTDVTEAQLQRTRQLRHQRLTALGEMSARMAHQLRTPLSTAILHMSHLSIAGLLDDERRQVHGKIQGRLHHIEELIDGMLSYVRGSERTNIKFSFSSMVSELVSIAELETSQKGGRVIQESHFSERATSDLSMPDISTPDVPVLCPPMPELEMMGCGQEILSALTMLVENAVQVSEVPVITISMESCDQWVDVYISDNGPGITIAESVKIFEPYYSTRPGGTGLGLAIAQVTAVEHGGDLSLVSSSQAGTRFRFRLPNPPRAMRALDTNQETEVEFCE